jgi:transcriptional regulator with XRE-family HTH domain
MDRAGKRIRDLRKARKLTQPQITDATGVPQSTLSEIERGESKDPSAEVLLKLAAFFEVEPEWLLSGRGPQHAVSSRGDGESELLLFFRSLSSEGQAYLLARAKDLHADEHRTKAVKSQDDQHGDSFPRTRNRFQ